MSLSAMLVVNPRAGRYSASRIALFVRILRHHGAKVCVVHTEWRNHGRELARQAVAQGNFTHIVAVGGDGTIAEIAAALMGSDVTLGILPFGTANVLAREMRIPFSIRKNALLLLSGRTATIWPGLFELEQGSQPDKKREKGIFIQMFGAGFDALVVRNVSVRVKSIIGRMAYMISLLETFRTYQSESCHVMVDGRTYLEVRALIVTKGIYYGGNYRLVSRTSQHSPSFSVVMLHSAGRMSLLRFGLALLLGHVEKLRDITICHDRQAVQVVPGFTALQADGDYVGHGSFSVTISPVPLHIVNNI